MSFKDIIAWKPTTRAGKIAEWSVVGGAVLLGAGITFTAGSAIVGLKHRFEGASVESGNRAAPATVPTPVATPHTSVPVKRITKLASVQQGEGNIWFAIRQSEKLAL